MHVNKKIDIIAIHFHTKRDTDGNVYWSTELVNPKNGKVCVVDAGCPSNVRHSIGLALNEGKSYENYANVADWEICTGSARISSLPDGEWVEETSYGPKWQSVFRRLGYRPKKL
jgi:hypothetical protein